MKKVLAMTFALLALTQASTVQQKKKHVMSQLEEEAASQPKFAKDPNAVDLYDYNFAQTVKTKGGKWIVEAYAVWCQHCKEM
jgi:thioredoxin-like negative regulator of GroEL